MESKYDSYGQSENSGSDAENFEMKLTTNVSVAGSLLGAYGTSSEYGESLGVSMNNVTLVDGVVGYDTEKDKYKAFSWKEAIGLSPGDAMDRGTTITADDVDNIIQKTYVGNQKTYDVVAARLDERADGDEVAMPGFSMERDVEVTDDGIDTSDWRELGGELPELPNIIMWFTGSDEYGPTASSSRIAQLVTQYGEDIIEDEDDVYNWLSDTSGNNILRADLQDRHVEYFKVSRESENGNTYHVPVLVDTGTGEEVQVNNRSTSENSTSSSSGQMSGESETSGPPETYPDPVADYINSAGNIQGMNEDRAGKLLDELVADPENPMSEGLLADAGGREHVIGEVV